MVDALSPKEVAERMHRTDAPALLLLDVREPEERAVAAIEPSIHIPMAEVPDRLEEIDKDRSVVVYCHHGNRSAMVAEYLAQAGYDSVFNLTGGIDAWSTQVDRKVPRYG